MTSANFSVEARLALGQCTSACYALTQRITRDVRIEEMGAKVKCFDEENLKQLSVLGMAACMKVCEKEHRKKTVAYPQD